MTVCRKTWSSWSFCSILSAQLGCCWTAGCICFLFTPALWPQWGGGGPGCSCHHTGLTGLLFAVSASAVGQLSWSKLAFSCLPKDAVAWSAIATMWSSAPGGMLSGPSCSYCSCSASNIQTVNLPIDQAVLRINKAPNRRALDYYLKFLRSL